MNSITFSTSFNQQFDLLFSPADLKSIYFNGTTSLLEKGELRIDDSVIEFYIREAQYEVENFLTIKLRKQAYTDKLHFTFTEWQTWGFIKTSYPVRCVHSLSGFLNTTKQVEYPVEWLSTKNNGDDKTAHRSIYLVPVGSAVQHTQNAVYSGILPQLGYMNIGTIPFYWTTEYVTGFDKVPEDIMGAVGSLASIKLLSVIGDNILGVPGLTSKSISLDGLSQSVNSSGFTGRIKQQLEMLYKKMNNLRDFYGGGLLFNVA